MLDRALVFAAFTFTIGAMLGPAERPVASLISAIVLVAIGVRATLRGRRLGPIFIAGGAFLAGFVATAWRLPREDTLAPFIASDVTLEGLVAEAPEPGVDASALIIDVTATATAGGRLQPARARVRVRVPRALVPGGASPGGLEHGSRGAGELEVAEESAHSGRLEQGSSDAGELEVAEESAHSGGAEQGSSDAGEVEVAEGSARPGELEHGSREAGEVEVAEGSARSQLGLGSPARAGDRVRVGARLRRPLPASVPALRTRRPAVRRGVVLAADARSVEVIERAAERSWIAAAAAPLGRVRSAAGAAIERCAPGSSGPLLRAIATGERASLPRADEERFQLAGLSHLLLLGGLHAAAMSLLACLALRRLLRSPRRAAMAAIPIAIVLAELCGGTPSTYRTLLVLVALLATAAAAQAETRTWAILGVAVIACITADPAALGDVAFQLPFAAIVAAMRTYPALAGALLARLPNRTRATEVLVRAGAFAAAIAAGVAPLVARLFDRVTLPVLAANGLALPLESFVIAPLALLGGLTGLLSDTLATPILALAAAALAPIAGATGHQPPLALPTPSLLECVLFYVAIIALSLPERANRRYLTPKRAALAAIAALATSMIAGAITTRSRGELRITYLPVPEGRATLLELPNGEAIAVTTTPPSAGFDLGDRALAGTAKLRRHTHLRAIIGDVEAARDLALQLPTDELWLTSDDRDTLEAGGARIERTTNGEFQVKLGVHTHPLTKPVTDLEVVTAH